jgi:histidinol-phosphate aminotransferase
MYGVLANLNAVENRVLLTEDFQPEIEKIMEAVDTNTKMIFYVRQITQLEIRFQMRV